MCGTFSLLRDLSNKEYFRGVYWGQTLFFIYTVYFYSYLNHCKIHQYEDNEKKTKLLFSDKGILKLTENVQFVIKINDQRNDDNQIIFSFENLFSDQCKIYLIFIINHFIYFLSGRYLGKISLSKTTP